MPIFSQKLDSDSLNKPKKVYSLLIDETKNPTSELRGPYTEEEMWRIARGMTPQTVASLEKRFPELGQDQILFMIAYFEPNRRGCSSINCVVDLNRQKA